MIRNVLLSLIFGLNSFVCVNAEKIEVDGIYYVLNNTIAVPLKSREVL